METSYTIVTPKGQGEMVRRRFSIVVTFSLGSLVKKPRDCTANPTWGDIFESYFKVQSSKLERLFSLKRGKRDVRALSFELSKMSPQVGLTVH